MTNFRSLVGGYFGDGSKVDARGKKIPVSLRANNPGAVNGAPWERQMPGYVTEIKYDGVNNTTVFETPEHGVAVYWTLLKKYRDNGRTTIRQIITRYIGVKGAQDYINSVTRMTGWSDDTVIDIWHDASVLPFAKAQFRHEAGVPIPWSDAQILYGFNLARGWEKPTLNRTPNKEKERGLILSLISLLAGLFRR